MISLICVSKLVVRILRIGLNTALLEGPPGELITDKTKVMEEANERAIKARNSLNKEKVDPQKEKEDINLSS